jgi:restriction system protein
LRDPCDGENEETSPMSRSLRILAACAVLAGLAACAATKSVFVTTSSFSPQARDFVQHLSQRVILLDGQKLADLMIERGVGVRTRRSVEFKRLDEDFFSEDD